MTFDGATNRKLGAGASWATPKPYEAVQSPSGRAHSTAGRGLLTACGVAYVDLFATYEAGAMWPKADGPIDCKNCLRVLAAR